MVLVLAMTITLIPINTNNVYAIDLDIYTLIVQLLFGDNSPDGVERDVSDLNYTYYINGVDYDIEDFFRLR